MKYLIIGDAGHAEKVAGKESPDKSLKEWRFNQEVDLKMKKRCADHGIDYYQTNPSPTGKDEMGLSKRAELANKYWKNQGKPKALFISYHANAHLSYFTDARGTETYVASNASQNSKNAAKYINDEIYNAFKKLDSNAKNRGVKTEDFTVIYKANMPSILVEYGFYTNKADLNILQNNVDDLVEATVKGICKYFGITYKSPTTIKIGWIKKDNLWYYCKNNIKQCGWIKDNDKWYYCRLSTGEMLTGWQKIDNKWYYLDNSGVMKTGWLKDKDKWYYLKEDGSMATGWIEIKGKKYYLHKNGVMENKHIDLEGKCYHFASSGELIKTTEI